jgi:glycosyltransferase involved in cell wall biosynthesis
MSLKSGRKSGWRALARRTGLLADVWLHGTSEAEVEDIRRGFPWARGYLVAPNVRELIDPAPREPRTDGVKRLAFVGRISRVKNLDYALKVLTEVKGRVAFDIYGPVAGYWAHCQNLIASTPPNVTVAYKGEIANAAVPGALATADLLFLPTKGENFGHAIFEALSCGVPVLIANTTPWRGLAALSAGWDLPLTDPAAFSLMIDQFVAMGADHHTALREGARRLAKRSILDGDAAAKARTMLRCVLTMQRNGAAA